MLELEKELEEKEIHVIRDRKINQPINLFRIRVRRYPQFPLLTGSQGSSLKHVPSINNGMYIPYTLYA